MKGLILILVTFAMTATAFAGTITNRKTKETINVSCEILDHDECYLWELTADLKSGMQQKTYEYEQTTLDKAHIFVNTLKGFTAPRKILKIRDEKTKARTALRIALTPITVAGGMVMDAVILPISIIKKMNSAKVRTNIHNLFRLDKKKSTKITNRAFKRLLKALLIKE
ncbi:MAG: hypothetical protein ACI9QD_000155 [Thermoproteota archaeon]|jgi:hypothetical protein